MSNYSLSIYISSNYNQSICISSNYNHSICISSNYNQSIYISSNYNLSIYISSNDNLSIYISSNCIFIYINIWLNFIWLILKTLYFKIIQWNRITKLLADKIIIPILILNSFFCLFVFYALFSFEISPKPFIFFFQERNEIW